MQIENWFGAKASLFLPRRMAAAFLTHQPVTGRIGFVGRLDHPPNLQGIEILMNVYSQTADNTIEIRLVGAPEAIGNQLAEKYRQINYLGELPDAALEKEAATWCILLNPVWWYSTGASTKLAKAISWGIPIVTTTAGMRGYKWNNGNLLVADTPQQMWTVIHENAHDIQIVNANAAQTKTVATSGYQVKELAAMLQQLIN
jgi:glycosyltransferase involved in cell wall biosynthesis